MKSYFLYCNNDKLLDFQYMVIATSFESPLSEYKQISEELRSLNFEGNVLFDMLAYNGVNSERFFTVYFDKTNFDFKTLNYLEIPRTSYYRKTTQSILKDNHLFLNNSVLSNAQKNLILHDITI